LRWARKGIARADVDSAAAVADGFYVIREVSTEAVPEQRRGGPLRDLHAGTRVALEQVLLRARRRSVEQHHAGARVADHAVVAEAQPRAQDGQAAAGVSTQLVPFQGQVRVDGVDGVAHVALAVEARADDAVVRGHDGRVRDVNSGGPGLDDA